MEKDIRPVAAFQDNQTRAAMQASLENLAGQIAQRQARFQSSLEQHNSEIPLLVATTDALAAPQNQPGMLWFVQNDGVVYYYDQAHFVWLAASVMALDGNQTVLSLGGGNWAVNTLAIPAKTFVTRAVVSFFLMTGCFGTIHVTQFGGAILGTQAFALGAAVHTQIVVPVNTAFVAAAGLEIEVVVTTGSLPRTSSWLEARRMA